MTISSNAPQGLAKVLMKKAAEVFKRIVQPSVIPIYAEHERNRQKPVQVGTGFLVLQNSMPVLVTARHTLRGKSFTEDPAMKTVHVNGRWVYIGDGNRKLIEGKERDIAIAYMNEFPVTRCLPSTCVAPQPYIPRIITFAGFLGRDFERAGGGLQPTPLIYSNVGIPVGPSLVGLRYPHRRNLNTLTSKPVVSSKPSGLSGGPMVDTLELIAGTVVIVGVFTEQDNGQARGEDAGVLQALLASL